MSSFETEPLNGRVAIRFKDQTRLHQPEEVTLALADQYAQEANYMNYRLFVKNPEFVPPADAEEDDEEISDTYEIEDPEEFPESFPANHHLLIMPFDKLGKFTTSK